MPIDRSELEEIITSSDKQRFALSSDGERVRANQGHSLPVHLGLDPVSPPDILYHGTVERFVSSILTSGLTRGSRQYVHLSSDIETAIRVGQRRGRPIVMSIAAGAMQAAGHAFFRSQNGVWLTGSVPVEFISVRPNDGFDE